MSSLFDKENVDIAWCPGCGNFGILKLIKEVLEELEVDKKTCVIVSGIGQAAKTPYYIDVNMFGVLHGRALPVATAVKLGNPNLCVVQKVGMATCTERAETTLYIPSDAMSTSCIS
ncbi:MAG: hypothetical protein RBT52_07805, partial [Sulfurimonas sp.]|nr:hypothetical protein [Sulfurimonas sp.]